MTRTLNSTVANQVGEYVYLYELDYSAGTLYLTNAPGDIVWSGHTYLGLGGSLFHDVLTETPDRKNQSVTLRLFGVNQTIIGTILANDFRNRDVRIYLVHFNVTTGAMLTPDLIWRGRQFGDYSGVEDRNYETGGRATLEVRISSALEALNIPNSIRSNTSSHNEGLRRVGQSLTPLDTFFERVDELQFSNIYWGQEAPRPRSQNGVSTGRTAQRREV